MIKKLYLNILRHGLKVLGVCGACFLIEACYGTPQGDYSDVKMKDVDVTGSLRSDEGTVLSNVPVLLTNGRFGDTISAFTDKNGAFAFRDIKGSKQKYHLIIKERAGVNETMDFMINKEDMLAGKKQIDLTIKS
jgi:hypothetical protein